MIGSNVGDIQLMDYIAHVFGHYQYSIKAPILGSAKRKKRIMTVDDDEDVVFCLRAVLQETGLFDVDGYTDPQHALCSFKPGEYDLAILDIRMPKMNGFELYRKIKLIDKIVDICFLTAVYEFNEYRVVHPDITDEIEKMMIHVLLTSLQTPRNQKPKECILLSLSILL
jgi:PleD family two-component response regulator